VVLTRDLHAAIARLNRELPYAAVGVSDEAHRTQAGKLARNMRLALPNAAFIGFIGTPLFEHDNLTKRIFGGYVSRYDFKRSEEDGATVKLCVLSTFSISPLYCLRR
jgi:type I restriction enzyme R subunit